MNSTEEKILLLLKKARAHPGIIAEKLNISRQALHRYLKKLVADKKIKKDGAGPHVTYTLNDGFDESRLMESIDFFAKKIFPVYLKRFSKKIKGGVNHFLKKNPLLEKGVHFGFMLDAAAVYSSNIEGNSLNLNSFLNNRMIPKKHRPKEAQEIEDLINAYELSQRMVLSYKNMLKAHAMLSKTFVSRSRQGIYRKEPVGVFSKQGMEYLAIEPFFLEREMKLFFKQIQTLIKKKLRVEESFFWASWIHLTMALIHPFSDGNGRIARLCEKWFLKECLGMSVYFLNSEEYYFKHRSDYYRSLKLGVNYWEVNFEKAINFMGLLVKSLEVQD